MLESNTEAKQATGTSSKLGQAGKGQAKGSEVPICLSRLTCHSMRHAPEPQSPFQELGTVVQVRRGWTVRQEQGLSPIPPHSPSLLNPCTIRMCTGGGARDSDSLQDDGA